jgi:hypothetical protein
VTTYQKAYNDIFDKQCGRETFEATRQAVATLEGQFSASEVINAACSIRGCVDTWDVLNTLDHLVTAGELRELTNRDQVWGQDRLYTSA